MLTASDITGMYAIIPTPANPGAERWDAIDTVNVPETDRLVKALIADGSNGIIALGTTGECATVTAPGGTLPGPILDAQTRFYSALAAAGLKPDSGSVIAWDPAMIVVDALRTLGPDASAEQIRAWIAQLHGWAGVSGLYDFRSGDQRGIGVLGAQIFRWDPAKQQYVRLGRPAGYLK